MKRRAGAVHSTFKLFFFSQPRNYSISVISMEKPLLSLRQVLNTIFISISVLSDAFYWVSFISAPLLLRSIKMFFSGNAEPTNETHFEWESNIVWSNFDRYTNPINFQNIYCNLTMLSECIHNACKYCF